MPDFLQLLYISLLVCCSVMGITLLVATAIKNYSIVDVVWAFNFAFIAIVIVSWGTGWQPRVMAVAAGCFLWSLRLGTHLATRVFSHIHEEEGRYKQLRVEWAAQLHFKFFLFFMAQGISNAVLALPLFIIASHTDTSFHLLEYIGMSIWLLAIIGEAISDWQLKQFKKNPANKGKVCDVGLWHYSRHPNYFFQLVIWIGVAVFAITLPYGWLSLLSPVAIGYLIFNVTGIPMTEEQSLRSKGEAYKRYQETTSVFVPWPPKTK